MRIIHAPNEANSPSFNKCLLTSVWCYIKWKAIIFKTYVEYGLWLSLYIFLPLQSCENINQPHQQADASWIVFRFLVAEGDLAANPKAALIGRESSNLCNKLWKEFMKHKKMNSFISNDWKTYGHFKLMGQIIFFLWEKNWHTARVKQPEWNTITKRRLV